MSTSAPVWETALKCRARTPHHHVHLRGNGLPVFDHKVPCGRVLDGDKRCQYCADGYQRFGASR